MDYFSVKKNYYTGSFPQVIQEIEKAGDSEDNTLVFYKLKTQLALEGKIDIATAGSSPLGKAFALYSEFLNCKDIAKLETGIPVESSSPFELNLLATGQAIAGKLDESLETCVYGIDNEETSGTAELLLLAIQVALLNEQKSVAETMFNNYINSEEDQLTSDDELIMNLAESYIKFASNQDTATSNFYYFEELSQTFPTWKTQLGLLNLHLQQGNVEEAQGIVNILESEYYSAEQEDTAKLYKSDFLASKITLSILSGSPNTSELKTELAQLDPNHAFVQNDKDINAKFDEIVASYKA